MTTNGKLIHQQSENETRPSPVRPRTPLSKFVQTQPSMSGRSCFVTLRDGLTLGVLDNLYPTGVKVDTEMAAGFNVYLCFGESDDLDVRVGGAPLPIGRNRGMEAGAFGFALWRDRATSYTRRAPPDAWTRAIMVCLSPGYLIQTFGVPKKALPAGAYDHLAISRWFPSHRLLNLATSLYDTEMVGSAALRLRDEIVALEILNEAMATIRPPMAREGGRTDMILLNRACDVIAAQLAGKLTVDAIAREVGVGTPTLRRLFVNGFGCTLADYIRDRRLDVARYILEEGGAVSAAAASAGYSSPKNFATAYRRRFGISPRRVRAGEIGLL